MHSALLQNKDNEADSYEIGKADNTSNGRHMALSLQIKLFLKCLSLNHCFLKSL